MPFGYLVLNRLWNPSYQQFCGQTQEYRPTCYPTSVKKTSVYLSDEDEARLQTLARRNGVTRAAVIRRALVLYESQEVSDRNFAMVGMWEGDGTSIADVPDEELFKGFGT